VKGVKVVSEDEDGNSNGDDGVVDDDRESESTQSGLLKLHGGVVPCTSRFR
jgi:hypothetical protein